ncbi:MAG: hypothetical protein AAFO69_13130, partial [Bacteroidota bacterium]
LTSSITEKHTGYQKIYSQNQLLDLYDYLPEEKKSYDMPDPTVRLNKKAKARTDAAVATYKANVPKNRLETLKEMLESSYDFEVEDVKDFEFINMGRFHQNPAFEFSYKVNMTDAIKKLGNDYLINIGSMAEQQVSIEKEELQRDYDINMPYPRSFAHEISLEIPAGYEVQGAEKLNVTTENEYGGFMASATVEGNQFVLKTKKYYTTNFVKKENWSDMLEYLQAALDFNGKSILVKKVN